MRLPRHSGSRVPQNSNTTLSTGLRLAILACLLLSSARTGLAQLLENERVQYPNPEVAFICGPQLRASSPLNRVPAFDTSQVTKGYVHGQGFPAIAPRELTGTVSVTAGSSTVNGSGTKFMSQIDPSCPAPMYSGWLRVYYGGTYREVKVSSVQTDSTLTLAAPWPHGSSRSFCVVGGFPSRPPRKSPSRA